MASARVFTKGCAFALLVWFLLIGAYAYVAWARIHDRGAAAAIGVLGGTSAGMVLSSIIGLFTGGRDRSAIRRAVNMEARRDGRLEAASGPIRALGQPLEAPFSGQPCVIYQYDVKPPGQNQSDFAGYAMTPCAIQTLQGPVNVLGWVMLDQFPAALDSAIDRGRAERYLSSATFDAVGVTGLLSAFRDLMADDDGTIRKDMRIGGNAVNLERRRLEERSIAPGTAVTILGRWSEARGGFPSGGATALNRLFPGDLESTRRQVGGSSVQTFAAAGVFFVLLHAILVPMYYFSPQTVVARAVGGSVWDERDCDVQKAKLDRGADPNERGRDAITPLMNAARMDDPACVRNLIAAGAHLEDRDKFGDTALVQAVTAGLDRQENASILLAAGAKDFRITSATGRRIADDAAPLATVRDYIEAVHKADFESMARLRAHVSVRRLEDQRDNLSFWQSRLPKTFAVEDGWMTDDAATLTIRGAASSGQLRIMFDVRRHPDLSRQSRGAAAAEGWQIEHEWYPDER